MPAALMSCHARHPHIPVNWMSIRICRKMSKFIVVNDIYKVKRSFKLCQRYLWWSFWVLKDWYIMAYMPLLKPACMFGVYFDRATWRLFLVIVQYNCGLKTLSDHISLRLCAVWSSHHLPFCSGSKTLSNHICQMFIHIRQISSALK